MSELQIDITSSDREIVVTRVFDAPRELVWEAFTDPRQIVQWWGPKGFTTTIEEYDLRPGGTWKHIMRGPDGAEYPNKSVFKEIIKYEKIAYAHGGAKKGGPGIHFEQSWTFDAVEGNRTRLTGRQVFESTKDREMVINVFGALEGAKGHFQCLSNHLAKAPFVIERTFDSASEQDFVITRVFDAPRELVWKAWTDPKHVTRWWGPKDFTNPVCQMNVRVGGAYRFVMRSSDGVEYPVEGFFRELVEPERLVMSMDCSGHPDSWHDLVNPNRDKSKKPALDCVQTVTFEKLDNKTRLTIRTRFESAAIRDAMVKVGMNDGWSQSLDRLDACIASLS